MFLLFENVSAPFYPLEVSDGHTLARKLRFPETSADVALETAKPTDIPEATSNPPFDHGRLTCFPKRCTLSTRIVLQGR
ncbi:hypothetical protein L596_000816 [Steinernema carpocapsae]|uniref:Uncharacterized protein n=1 Tax=Steinernema carpocapsae TaxID=34508 RepID=A0A4U8UJB6_STECR|nr:hypothetical protein L596_000816 [Steinernema carpocapsae]